MQVFLFLFNQNILARNHSMIINSGLYTVESSTICTTVYVWKYVQHNLTRKFAIPYRYGLESLTVLFHPSDGCATAFVKSR